MVRLWSTRPNAGVEVSQAALGGNEPGEIAVVVATHLDLPLVFLASQIAREAKRKLHLLHIIIVPRTLHLNAIMPKESARADTLLNSALQITAQRGCEGIAELVQTRDAGSAIVAEAEDRAYSLLMLRLVSDCRTWTTTAYLGTTVPYVLAHAPCRVWLVSDPPSPWDGGSP